MLFVLSYVVVRCCRVSVVGCCLRAARCLVFVVLVVLGRRCPLLLAVVRCLLLVVAWRCVWCVVRCALFVVCCSLFVVRC